MHPIRGSFRDEQAAPECRGCCNWSSLEAGGELFSPWQTPVSPQWDLSLLWPWWHSQHPAWFFSKKPASQSCCTQSLGGCWHKISQCLLRFSAALDLQGSCCPVSLDTAQLPCPFPTARFCCV